MPPSQASPSSSGRHGDRRERGRRLRLVEAEALRELGRNQVAQRPVVDEHQQPDVPAAPARRVVPIGTSSVITATSPSKSMPNSSLATGTSSRGAEQVVGAALVHQRIGPEARRHLRAARLAHELDMVDVGRAVGPVIARAAAAPAPRAGSKRHAAAARPSSSCCETLAQQRRAASPSRRARPAASARSAGTGDRPREIAAHDDERPSRVPSRDRQLHASFRSRVPLPAVDVAGPLDRARRLG